MIELYPSSRARELEPIVSKWTIVRQRLPEILMMSTTYKPTHIRSQLNLLIALMNKQNPQLRQRNQDALGNRSNTLPTTVIISIDGRQRYIEMKLVPPQQMIHIDFDGIDLTIPTRDFIMAISRGDIHETAIKYCPLAVRQMLMDLSKAKLVHDGRLYRKTLIKIRLGKLFYSLFFIFIIGMFFILVISTSNSLWKLGAFNTSTISSKSIKSTDFFFDNETFVTFD